MFAGVTPVEDAGCVTEVVGMDAPALGTNFRREELLIGLTLATTAWPIARGCYELFGRLAVFQTILHVPCVRWRPASRVLSTARASEDGRFWREIPNWAGYNCHPLRGHVVVVDTNPPRRNNDEKQDEDNGLVARAEFVRLVKRGGRRRTGNAQDSNENGFIGEMRAEG